MSKSNPFNLPPPWNAGYELPQNVDDEGLERHAFTTAWAARGSFDDPKVGYAGYAVPGYIKEEGYGRGAMTTRWAPRGSYFGPKVPHWLDRPSARVVGRKPMPGGATQLKIQTMAGFETARTGGMAPFTEYGQRAARALLDTVAAMPESMRQPQLKAALNAIDPKLWSRAEEGANKELKAGVPARVALYRGLASAMSMGIGMELVELGKGKAPARQSQLGMVCYGRSGLGEAVTMQLMLDPAIQVQLMTAIAPPPREGYEWIPASSCQPTAHWERAMAPGVIRRDPCTPEAIAQAAKDEESRLRSLALQDRSTDLSSKGTSLIIEVGPFLMPLAKEVRVHMTLTPEQAKFIADNTTKTYQEATRSASGFFMAISTLGFSARHVRDSIDQGLMPIAKFQRPTDAGDPYSGKMYGLYTKKDSDGKAYIQYKLYVPGDSFFDTVWKNIQTVRAAIHSFVKDALDAVKGAACTLVSSPVGKIGAGAVGAYYGGPTGAAAGVKGAEMAAEACKDLPPCQPGLFMDPATKVCNLPPLPEKTNLTPFLILGGVGIAAMVFLGMKKKQP